MIHLFVIAGISLTASSISWWNGQQSKALKRQIRNLEEKLDKIYAADYIERRKLFVSYALEMSKLVEMELATRNQVATELIGSHYKAKSILEKHFGSEESQTFYQVVLELELALGRVNAEIAYFSIIVEVLADVISGNNDTIPSPADLVLPNDFPREGGLVHFQGEVPKTLHDYHLQIDDWSEELDGRAMLHTVDHGKRIARVSVVGAGLLEANLTDGGGRISAKVTGRDQEGIYFDYLGVALLLRSRPQEYSRLTPELQVDVYPHVWLLSQISKLNSKSPLPVSLVPRVSGSRKYWSPILLSVSENKLTELVGAYEIISNVKSNTPWQVFLIGSSQVGFSLGGVTLLTTVAREKYAFELDKIVHQQEIPAASIRFHAELAVYVPGTNDDASADKSIFLPFVEALNSELSSQKRMLLQRKTAVKLRKLSLIYQDQQEHIQTEGTCGFLPGEVQSGGRTIIGMITNITRPGWLNEAASGESGVRLQISGQTNTWSVRQLNWVDAKLGIVRIELDVDPQADFHEINPFALSRIERIGEGSLQQTLSKALENAILGKFVSPRVHEELLGLAGNPIPNTNITRDSVEALLYSDEPVVCIWGPPGTGKTTLLVNWLSSLFDVTNKHQWPRVLISAPTHVAITKLVVDLLEKIPNLENEVVRYGNRDKVEGTELESVWHEKRIAALNPEDRSYLAIDESFERWKRLLSSRDGREAAAKWLLGSKHIHAVTCTGMARVDYGLWSRSFDLAIIDEAGKAFGAELLIPASVAKKVVLIGDHNQLPPTVTTDMLDDEINYCMPLSEVEELLKRNMFHEVFEQLPSEGKGMLSTQYRMHSDIGDIVSEMFYSKCLESYRKDKAWSLTSHRLAFVDFSKVLNYKQRNIEGSASIENPTERAALYALLRHMDKSGRFAGYSVLIVCPYKGQRDIVDSDLNGSNYSLNLEVTTVDAVQGGEADIVIVMMTRSTGNVQFLLDRHRLNVALSRARDAVYIFGHAKCLSKNDHSPIADLLRIGRRNKTLKIIELPPKANFYSELSCLMW